MRSTRCRCSGGRAHSESPRRLRGRSRPGCGASRWWSVSSCVPPLHFRNLIEAPLMASAFERRLEPYLQDFVGKSERDDPPAHREDVCVVVLTRETGGIQIVTQRGANARHLVRGDLLALAASAEDDTTVGPPLDDRARNVEADRRI